MFAYKWWRHQALSAQLHNRCWIYPEPFKQLLVIFPLQPPALDEQTGQTRLARKPLRIAATVWGTISLSISYQSVCVSCMWLWAKWRQVKPFRYPLQGIKVFLASAVWGRAFCCGVPHFPFLLLPLNPPGGIRVSRALKWSSITLHWAQLCVYFPLPVSAHADVLPA